MILRPHLAVLALTTALTLTACAATPPRAASNGTPVPKPAAAPAAVPAPFPSTYVAPATTPTLIKGATVLTGTGKRLERTDVLLRDGKIAAIGVSLSADANTRVIDGKNKWVTPGIMTCIRTSVCTPRPVYKRIKTVTKRPHRRRPTFGQSIRFGHRTPGSRRHSKVA